ncbi:unnamed protein product [Brachionus calyciflorus]|uniref:Uncharacterized protein n=1 Tax=Brachionus calyciflorus TaxID=104777 RepID=A0A813YVY5_9BILA|nr:unnamed protein product [Brachionus calyciflorus]
MKKLIALAFEIDTLDDDFFIPELPDFPGCSSNNVGINSQSNTKSDKIRNDLVEISKIPEINNENVASVLKTKKKELINQVKFPDRNGAGLAEDLFDLFISFVEGELKLDMSVLIQSNKNFIDIVELSTHLEKRYFRSFKVTGESFTAESMLNPTNWSGGIKVVRCKSLLLSHETEVSSKNDDDVGDVDVSDEADVGHIEDYENIDDSNVEHQDVEDDEMGQNGDLRNDGKTDQKSRKRLIM